MSVARTSRWRLHAVAFSQSLALFEIVLGERVRARGPTLKAFNRPARGRESSSAPWVRFFGVSRRYSEGVPQGTRVTPVIIDERRFPVALLRSATTETMLSATRGALRDPGLFCITASQYRRFASSVPRRAISKQPLRARISFSLHVRELIKHWPVTLASFCRSEGRVLQCGPMSGSFPTLLRPRFGLRGLLLTIATLGALLAVGRFWFDPGPRWEKFSRQRVQQETAKGNVVLVNFTADWNISTARLKRFLFARLDVRAIVFARGIVPLEADYTDTDIEITNELSSLRQLAVPLVVIYPAGSSGAPVILDYSTTPDQLKSAIRQAAPNPVGRLLRYPAWYGGVGTFVLIGIAWWLARRQNQPAAENLDYEVPSIGCLDAND